jgi:hypothetical protein
MRHARSVLQVSTARTITNDENGRIETNEQPIIASAEPLVAPISPSCLRAVAPALKANGLPGVRLWDRFSKRQRKAVIGGTQNAHDRCNGQQACLLAPALLGPSAAGTR